MGDQTPNPIPKLELPPDDRNSENIQEAPDTSSKIVTTQQQANGIQVARSNSNQPRPPPPTQIPAPTSPFTVAGQRVASAAKSPTDGVNGTADSARERTQRTERPSPSWPTSPRLKSPPPSAVRPLTARRAENIEQAQSNVAVKRLAPVSGSDLGAAMYVPIESAKESIPQSTVRVPGRGVSAQATGLETVAEGSVPTTPSIGPVINPPRPESIHETSLANSSELPGKPTNTRNGVATAAFDSTNRLAPEPSDGGSLSAPASRATSTSRTNGSSNLAKRSFTSLTAKKPAVEPMRSMTVETETVTSTPQLLVDRGRDGGGSVKAKPSVETIRPKKDKKKTTRKAPSLHAGTGTSKADIFEAKVASAVDEADSSDSDETFVYESNPPDPRPSRHHSRTPSATSTTSQVDHHGIRGKHGLRSGSTAIVGKKSMKFSSGAYNNQLEAEASGGDGGRNGTRANGSTVRHHHIGRHGRNGHPSIIDTDSPFAPSNRTNSPKTPTAHGTRHSRPNSPRVSNGRFSNSRKSVNGGYDTYDDGADDERAPLMGSIRVNRNRHSRRPHPQFRSMEFSDHQDVRCWPRYGGCFLLAVLVAIVSLGITTFVLALNRPLLDVEVRRIENVLASEQELMLDLHVKATNPNLFTIAVDRLDADLFAQSPYAGTSEEWRNGHGRLPRSSIERRRKRTISEEQPASWFPPFWPTDGVDEGTDPIEDPEPGNQKLLIGRIYKFDSPLSFEPSPFHHAASSSSGAIRLTKPGNKTVEGGSARWERVIQHQFDLIIQGVIQYQLPMSSRLRSAKIRSRIKVSPDHDGDDNSTSTRVV